MSSATSHASPSSGGRQLQRTTSRNSNQQPASHKPQYSPSIGSNLHQSPSSTSYSSHGIDSLTNSAPAQSLYIQETQAREAQVDNHESQLNVEPTAHHLSYGSYLTPDYGSDIPFSELSNYTSPSLEDLLWQEGFNTTQSLEDFGNDGTLVNNIFDNIDTSVDLQGIVPKDQPASPINSRSLAPHMSSAMASTSRALPPDEMKVGHSKRSRMSDDEDEQYDGRFSRSTSDQRSFDTTGQSMSQIVKPTVLISTYNRGDSPARTAIPLARSLSKRSQSSRLSDQAEALAIQDTGSEEQIPASSRLMPPDHHDSGHWHDDEDDEDDIDRAGIPPANRNDATIPSANDMEKDRQLEETVARVENWRATSETGTYTGADADRSVPRNRNRRERIRSRSTGGRADQHGAIPFSDAHVPGPGLLLEVDSEPDYSDDGSSYVSSDEQVESRPDSPAAQVVAIDPGSKDAKTSYFPPVDDNIPPEQMEPLPRQFYRRTPFQDPARPTTIFNDPNQPPTSNHAIMQWYHQVSQNEGASRAATWGTRRRLSDSEVASIVDGSKVRQMSLSNKARDRGNSFINRARTVMRRSSSTIKKSKEHLPRHPSPSEADKATVLENDPNHTATSPIQQVQRTFSWGKSKSPPMTSTGGALMAMTGQLTAIGGSTATSNVDQHDRPKSPFLSALKRSRSKSEVPKTPKTTPGLSDLITRHGGPPMPTLASPMHLRNEPAEPHHVTDITGKPDVDMDEDDEDDEVPIKMEMPIQSYNIIPNLDGFKTHAKEVNPRLQPYLVERIAQDQLRRYKKLVKNKVEHTAKIQGKQQCPSGPFCVELGGKPKILPPRTSAKDSTVNYAQFKVGNGGDSDGDEAAFVEGAITPALFPPGIPVPPTTHLPAEFECPLCFQVKKFNKPSDWTKHVHEDVQPFSCTFPNCPEPKSFKRKADWVRHENERHRHLEWWKCDVQDCAHICYRKDNFVQHLVREHKMTEPKSKGKKPADGKTRAISRSAPSLGQSPEEFWQLVEHCRHDTAHVPRQEPCKFCGNVCNTWKKLSVHVGKHMEQIAMPVLDLAAKRAVTADTIISPIDPPNRNNQNSMLDTTGLHAGLNGNNLDALSPYSASAVSGYQNSSAGQSPVPVHSTHGRSASSGQLYYNQNVMQAEIPLMAANLRQFTQGNLVQQNIPYQSFEIGNGQGYLPVSQQVPTFTQQSATQSLTASFGPQSLPRSQPMDPGYGNLNVDTLQASLYSQDGYYPNSAPGHSYMTGFNNGIDHADPLHNTHHVHTGHLHNPGSNTHPGTIDYSYAHHQHGANGGQYYR